MSLTNYTNAMSCSSDGISVNQMVKPLYDGLSSHCLTSAGLVIKAGGGLLVKAGSAFWAMADGVLVNKAANTDMAALSGTILPLTHNVFCFFIDKAGTLTSAMGTTSLTASGYSAIVFPPMPEKKAMIGFVYVAGHATNTFIGNDGTAGVLDGTTYTLAASTYCSLTGPLNPTTTI